MGYDKKDDFIHFFELEGDSAHDHIAKWSEDGALLVTPMANEAKACILKEMRVKRISPTQLHADAIDTSESGEQTQYKFRFNMKATKATRLHPR